MNSGDDSGGLTLIAITAIITWLACNQCESVSIGQWEAAKAQCKIGVSRVFVDGDYVCKGSAE